MQTMNGLHEKCKHGFPSVQTVSDLLRGKHMWRTMVAEYTWLYTKYIPLCNRCNDQSDSLSDGEWIKCVSKFTRRVTDIQHLLKKNTTFRQSVRALCCDRVRCTNMIHWNQHLDEHLFNWMCHKTADIGHRAVALSRADVCDYRKHDLPELDAVYYKLVQACEIMSMELGVTITVLRARVDLANQAFYAAFHAREVRFLEDPDASVCGEILNEAHAFEMKLVELLCYATEIWLDVYT